MKTKELKLFQADWIMNIHNWILTKERRKDSRFTIFALSSINHRRKYVFLEFFNRHYAVLVSAKETLRVNSRATRFKSKNE